MEREKTGIKGVDSMIRGGLPQGSVIGISGPPGIGKSLFVLHFLLEGARKGQKCVYVNLEEPLSNINNLIKQFSFSKEFEKFIKQRKIVIKCFNYENYHKIYSELFEKLKEDKNIKRFVIDSFNGFFSTVHNESLTPDSSSQIRLKIGKTFNEIRGMGLTSLLVLEKDNTINNLGIYYNIPYLVDGIVNLDFLELGTIERRIFIPKMRWTDQYRESKSYEICKKGIKVFDEKE